MSVSGAVATRTGPVRRAFDNDFLRHGALVFSASMAANVLNYLFNFAISRRVGVEGFATLSALVSFLMLLSIPTAVLTLVIVKYAAVFHAAGDAPRVRRLSQVTLKWTSLGACAAFVIGLVLRPEIGAFLRIGDSTAIVLCLAVIAVGLVTPSVRGILQGEQDFVRYSVSTVLEALLKVALAVWFVYAGFGVAGAMWGWLFGSTFALVYTVGAVLRKHGASVGDRTHLNLDIHRLAQTTLGIGMATGILTCLSFMDVLLVKHYFSAYQAGLYAAVSLTGKVVLFLVGFVPAVLVPKAVLKSSRQENAVPLLLQAAAVTLVMSAVVVGLFGVMPATIVRILAGGAFVGAAPYVLQYDIAIALLAGVALLVNYSIGVHRFGFLYPLGTVLVAEVLAIAFYHYSIWDIVHVLLLGNATAVLACGYPLRPAGAVPA